MLRIRCAPVTWPIGMGRDLRGIYHLLEDRIYVYEAAEKGRAGSHEIIDGLASDAAGEFLGERARAYRDEVELVRGASHGFALDEYRAGRQTPVFFGSAINNFGVTELLNAFVEHAPAPLPRPTTTREVDPHEAALTGFVFKIQANMDPGHRDRIAFMRICSGRYAKGMRMFHVRLGKEIRIADALTFLAADRSTRTRPTRATSSACTTTARSTSATRSPRARSSCSPACRTSRRNSSAASCCATRCA